MPKPDQIPPMTWVRAFFEAARQRTFKAAAAALNVSPSTISHEIRKLESLLEAPLFDRSGRNIVLTDEGEQLFESLQPVFSQLENAFLKFGKHEKQTLRLGVLPFISSEFVLPRMNEIEILLGGRTLELSPNNHLASLSQANSSQRPDAIIRYSAMPLPAYKCIELTTVSLALVQGAEQGVPNTLKRIQTDGQFDAWERLQEANPTLPVFARSALVVDNYVSALRAVEQGLGVSIAVLPLSASWLSQKRIKRYTNEVLSIPEKYWLVFSKQSSHYDVLCKLGEWLAEEFRNVPPGPE